MVIITSGSLLNCVVIENQLAPHIVLCQHPIPMNKKFIHHGCQITIDGTRAVVRMPNESQVEIHLKFTGDHDKMEDFIKDYIDLNLAEKTTV